MENRIYLVYVEKLGFVGGSEYLKHARQIYDAMCEELPDKYIALEEIIIKSRNSISQQTSNKRSKRG
jgi:hypothetical protein